MIINEDDRKAIETGDVDGLELLSVKLLSVDEDLMTPQADLNGMSVTQYAVVHNYGEAIKWMTSENGGNIPEYELVPFAVLLPKTSDAVADEDEEGVKAPAPYDPCAEYAEVWVKGPKVLRDDSSLDFECLLDSLMVALNANGLYETARAESNNVPPNYVYVPSDGLCFYHAVLWLLKFLQTLGFELPDGVYTTESELYEEQYAAAKNLQEVTLEYVKTHLAEFLSEADMKYQSASPNPWADELMIAACAHKINVNIHFDLYNKTFAIVGEAFVPTDGAAITLEIAGIDGTHFAPHQTNGDSFGASSSSSSSSTSADAALLLGALPFASGPF